MSEQTLKPCPFCGNIVNLESYASGIYCTECEATGPSCGPRETYETIPGVVADKWNQRSNEPQWISVDDTLPEPQTDVLCSFIDGQSKDRKAVVTDYCEGFWTATGSYDPDYGDRLTHWMPLPKPPTISKKETVDE